MMTKRPSAPDVAALRRELGRIEDHVTATGWAWDAELSPRVDHLLVLIEEPRA
jgi:hypothetical protein